MNKEEVVQLNKLKRKTGLFFIIVMGVMLICFNFLIQFEVNKEKISASYTAEDTVRKIETQLGRYLENSEMFKNIISSKHTISDEPVSYTHLNINKDNNPTTWPHMLEIVNGNPNPNYFWSTVN